jgi:hypothetical protein
MAALDGDVVSMDFASTQKGLPADDVEMEFASTDDAGGGGGDVVRENPELTRTNP